MGGKIIGKRPRGFAFMILPALILPDISEIPKGFDHSAQRWPDSELVITHIF
jgi:hypothetical protein